MLMAGSVQVPRQRGFKCDRRLGDPASSEIGDPLLLAAVSSRIVSRPALFDQLDRAARVTEVSAPAGSGKTTLLRSWVEGSGLAERTAYVSVHGDASDPQRFWMAVVDSLRGTLSGS